MGVDSNKFTVTWGMKLMLERENLLKMFEPHALQWEDETASNVEVNTDRFVLTRGKEQCHQLMLNRERQYANLSHTERSQGGCALHKKIPMTDLYRKGSCQVYGHTHHCAECWSKCKKM